MATALDEIGELVDRNTVDCEAVRNLRRVSSATLPVERHSLPTTANISDSLAEQYRVIDLPAIMGTPHEQKSGRIRYPRFGLFDPFKDGVCRLELFIADSGASVTAGHAWAWKQYQSRAAEKAKGRSNRVFGGLWLALSGVGAAVSIALAFNIALPWLIGVAASPLIAFVLIGMITDFELPPKTISLTAYFVGLIPADKRLIITQAAKSFDEVLLVQEVPKWNATVTYEQKIDPLVIGIKDGAAYLIDRFDTTTLEEYVAREFSA